MSLKSPALAALPALLLSLCPPLAAGSPVAAGAGPGAAADGWADIAAVAADAPGDTAVDAGEDLPNDPYFARQWYHGVLGSAAAWRHSNGAGVVVAIVDTGVDCEAPDIWGQCVPGRDFANDDWDPADDHGHGTFMAGLVAAVANNGVGMTGMAGGARIMPLKALGAAGSGSMDDIAAAIVWAVDDGADVVNLALGGMFTSPQVREAVQYALDHGVVVVAAAGSEATSNPTYPAAYPGVIAVTSTTPSDQRASFANFGRWVDIAAPGTGVLSTARNGSYQAWSGTSLSASLVSGVAALLIGQDPTRSPADIERLLAASAQDLGAAGADDYFGAGRVDAGRALALGAQERVPGPMGIEPPPGFPSPPGPLSH